MSEARTIQVNPDMPPEIRDDDEPTERPGPSPHYIFVHQLLRELVRDERFWSSLFVSTDNDDGIADVVFAKMCGDVGGDPASAKPTAHRIEGGVLVRMPPPEGMTECHFVAIFA